MPKSFGLAVEGASPKSLGEIHPSTATPFPPDFPHQTLHQRISRSHYHGQRRSCFHSIFLSSPWCVSIESVQKMQNSTERNTVSLDEEKGGTTFVEHTTMNDQHGVDKKMTIKEYAMSRLPTLKPQRTVPPNPFKLLGLLSRKDWLFFSVRPIHGGCGISANITTGGHGGMDLGRL